jgi:hypothetical protein
MLFPTCPIVLSLQLRSTSAFRSSPATAASKPPVSRQSGNMPWTKHPFCATLVHVSRKNFEYFTGDAALFTS